MNLECLDKLVARRHNDEDVYIAIRVWCPIGVRAEEDDLVGMELLRDPACKTLDHSQRNVRTPVVARQRNCG